MYEIFLSKYKFDLRDIQRSKVAKLPNYVPSDLLFLFETFGGYSFNNGLYRVISSNDQLEWEDRVIGAFPEFVGRFSCFGFDWLGSVFALDNMRTENGKRAVLMFDIGAAEALEIPANVDSFHGSVLVELGEAALATSFYANWLRAGGAVPGHDQCVGYKLPLFLGGSDTISNLEVSDLDVYWRLVGDLARKAKGLPKGTTVRVVGGS